MHETELLMVFVFFLRVLKLTEKIVHSEYSLLEVPQISLRLASLLYTIDGKNTCEQAKCGMHSFNDLLEGLNVHYK